MSEARSPLHVRPIPGLRVPTIERVAHRALLPSEPLVVLGAERVPSLASSGVRPERGSCLGPRGVALASRGGPLWISDTGHHRLLGYRARPGHDRAPADWVIGQPDFESEGRNAKGPISRTSVNVPTGIAVLPRGGLAVADAWNHRVLLWKSAPEDSNVPADRVLGQADFTSGEPNRGRRAAADTLCWPYGVAWIEGRLFVADSQNRRVLVWDELPVENGQPADRVLGQRRLDGRDENAGGMPDAASMRWPHGICSWRGNLCVSDAGNNRVLVWNGMPTRSGHAAAHVLGQLGPSLVDHNQSEYFPRDNSLNMPYALTALDEWLVVADTGSSRLLGFHASDLRTGASARALAGQPSFYDKGDNRWRAPVADSLCWPYGLGACDGVLAVADCGNNRVSLWELAV